MAASRPATRLLSVVVASFRARAILEACLARLLPQCETSGAELLVARSADRGDLAALAAAHPMVRVVAAPPGADLPRVRGVGLAAATGRLVALTEDHCLPAEDWVEAVGRHVDGTVDVVGGAMENARCGRPIDWGAYFAEYGFFAGASTDDDAARPLLTGANVAYHRRVVGDVAAWALDGAWENVAHARLAAAGATMRFDPAMRVAQGLSYALPAFCGDRYRHGRDYARTRLAEESVGAGGRWLRAISAPVLPPVLVWRIARRVRRAEHRAAFATALPFTFTFLAAWSIGEAIGYVRGPSR
jgi:hypothetical protein